MIHLRFGKTASALLGGAGTFALAATLSGCALGNIALSGPAASSNTLAVQGNVHGGQQPVSGSVINVYAVGNTGYGSNATPIITGTTVSDANGNFSLAGVVTCPSPSSLVYITATGGNPGVGGTVSNSAIKMAAGLGACSSLTAGRFININEVTTAATAFALAQYFTGTYGVLSTDSFGAPATTQAQLGITNAFATIKNLADTTSGNAITTSTIASSLGNITVTPESAKLNTIANILAACVNTTSATSTQCQTLFAATPPTGTSMPSDTLQAAVLMNLNPTSTNATDSTTNITALFGLQTAVSPFIGLTTQPTDWTLGINYSAGTSATQTLINGANGLAIDGLGNIWIINLNSSATATESLAEFSPTGTPLANPLNSGAAPPASLAADSPRNLAIDTNNNVFVTATSSPSNVYEYLASSGTVLNLPVSAQPYGLTIDGSNNIFVSHNSTTSNTFSFEEFTNDTLAATNQIKFPFDSNSTTNQFAAIATNGTLYLSRGSTNSTSILAVTNRDTSSCATFPCTTATATYTPVTTGSISNPYGMAAAANGGLWVADNGASNVTYVSGTTGVAYGSTASFLTPRFVAVDGANIAWFTNRGTSSVSEITTNGVILSPVTNGTAGAVGFQHSAGMSTQAGIGIDPSGNVWVANGQTSATSSAVNSLFEMVGAAAPTVTPISLALKNGTVGQKP